MFYALVALSLLSFDPDLGPGPEGCAFLPTELRMALPPDDPCYIPPPPPICYDEHQLHLEVVDCP